MVKFKKIAFLFPGQGSQYVSMGRDFYDTFSVCKETFQEADDLLERSLSSIIFGNDENELLETRNSQTGIYVMSMAILRLIKNQFPSISPSFTAGLSLGEYTALTASDKLDFSRALPLVQKRGVLMNEACIATKGSMAVIIGLNPDQVETMVEQLNLPLDLWVANFNCPGQVVISGTLKGLEKGMQKAKDIGAKRVMPLSVHGAFHSGLMSYAKDRLSESILSLPFSNSDISLVMNTTGCIENDIESIKTNLINQVTHSVRWQMGIEALEEQGVDLYIEMGPGKSLAGMNKRIGCACQTISIEKVEDLNSLQAVL